MRRWLFAGVAAEILPVKVSLTPFTAIFSPLGIRYRDNTIGCGMVLQNRYFEGIGFFARLAAKTGGEKENVFSEMLPPTFIY
ncbi:hypothetical protein [Desulfofundulus thermocisternus]|uniref:hypothetical protein n=1 Tax=Desulfofundulus thermocisternus TaxID=42471 RepID=UPI0019EA62E4|nr:hypothetical protein [Desulfofundulus thermocisternus]MBE3586006.1 hypothetical protein [Thermoanaerobacter sp.]MCS5695072.1 hypothetical protein [Desulfofundulus thermocisternus]